jgi:hypothetical protein
MFYGAWVFIAMLIKGGLERIYPDHKLISYVRMIHLVQPFHLDLCLDLSCDHLFSGLPPKILNQYLTSSLRATRSTQLILLCFFVIKYFVKHKLIKLLILQFHSSVNLFYHISLSLSLSLALSPSLSHISAMSTTVLKLRYG